MADSLNAAEENEHAEVTLNRMLTSLLFWRHDGVRLRTPLCPTARSSRRDGRNPPPVIYAPARDRPCGSPDAAAGPDRLAGAPRTGGDRLPDRRKSALAPT